MAERLEAISLPEAEPDPPAFEKQNVDEPVFLAVLKEALATLADHDVPFLVIGGVASAVWGRWSRRSPGTSCGTRRRYRG